VAYLLAVAEIDFSRFHSVILKVPRRAAANSSRCIHDTHFISREVIMKKITASLAVLFVFWGVGTCYGDQSKTHSWTVGPQISYIEYNEPDIMKEKGLMYGVAGSYTYNKGFVLKAEGLFSYGKVDYTGSGSGDLNNINDYLFEIRALGGYELKISDTFNITPFLGFGYRYLRDDTSGMATTTGARGYLRESNYYLNPVIR